MKFSECSAVLKLAQKITSLSNNPVISMVVLVGFLCLQFHSFSHLGDHVDYHSHNENTTEQISEHTFHKLEVNVDCNDCVLTKHLYADNINEGFKFIDHKCKFIIAPNNESDFALASHSFNLRAPPSHTV